MPPKYRRMADFHRYYSGARKAPYLTLFVGGNHEASNHLLELYYGGWVAPNIYYLGAANVVRVGPLRIAGMSGIWKGYDYRKPHHERLPFSADDVKSIYHVREIDTRKLLQVRMPVDVGISHDWPRGVEWKGDWKTLFRIKRGFEEDARSGNLGNVAAQQVMERLRPKYWLSAHLHVKYAAVVGHKKARPDRKELTKGDEKQGQAQRNSSAEDAVPIVKNEDEIDLNLDDDEMSEPNATGNDRALLSKDEKGNKEPITAKTDDSRPPAETSQVQSVVPESLRAQLPSSFTRPKADNNAANTTSSPPQPEAITNDTTYFLALDKCLPNKHFLQLISARSLDPEPQHGPVKLQYDKEWLAITRVFANDIVVGSDKTTSSTDADQSAVNTAGQPAQAAPSAQAVPPNLGQAHYLPLIKSEERWVEENIVREGLLNIPHDFLITAPVYDEARGEHVPEPPREWVNQQTERYCKMLGIRNPVEATEEEIEARMARGPQMGGTGGFGWRGGRGGRGGFGGHRGHGGRGQRFGRGRGGRRG